MLCFAPVVQQDAGTATARWAKAIETESPCLACHGPAVEASLEKAIRQLYPDDPATGFEPGRLRGLLWVGVPEGGTANSDSARESATADTRQPILLSHGQAPDLRR